MYKDSAAAPLYPRVQVVIEDPYEIVQSIIAPQPFSTGRIGMLHRTIVVAIARLIGPSICRFDTPNLRPRRTADPICPIKDLHEPKPTARRRPVTLTFARCQSAFAERTLQHASTYADMALLRRTR
jgi:hypothetical protein